MGTGWFDWLTGTGTTVDTNNPYLKYDPIKQQEIKEIQQELRNSAIMKNKQLWLKDLEPVPTANTLSAEIKQEEILQQFAQQDIQQAIHDERKSWLKFMTMGYFNNWWDKLSVEEQDAYYEAIRKQQEAYYEVMRNYNEKFDLYGNAKFKAFNESIGKQFSLPTFNLLGLFSLQGLKQAIPAFICNYLIGGDSYFTYIPMIITLGGAFGGPLFRRIFPASETSEREAVQHKQLSGITSQFDTISESIKKNDFSFMLSQQNRIKSVKFSNPEECKQQFDTLLEIVQTVDISLLLQTLHTFAEYTCNNYLKCENVERVEKDIIHFMENLLQIQPIYTLLCEKIVDYHAHSSTLPTETEVNKDLNQVTQIISNSIKHSKSIRRSKSRLHQRSKSKSSSASSRQTKKQNNKHDGQGLQDVVNTGVKTVVNYGIKPIVNYGIKPIINYGIKPIVNALTNQLGKITHLLKKVDNYYNLSEKLNLYKQISNLPVIGHLFQLLYIWGGPGTFNTIIVPFTTFLSYYIAGPVIAPALALYKTQELGMYIYGVYKQHKRDNVTNQYIDSQLKEQLSSTIGLLGKQQFVQFMELINSDNFQQQLTAFQKRIKQMTPVDIDNLINVAVTLLCQKECDPATIARYTTEIKQTVQNVVLLKPLIKALEQKIRTIIKAYSQQSSQPSPAQPMSSQPMPAQPQPSLTLHQR